MNLQKGPLENCDSFSPTQAVVFPVRSEIRGRFCFLSSSKLPLKFPQYAIKSRGKNGGEILIAGSNILTGQEEVEAEEPQNPPRVHKKKHITELMIKLHILIMPNFLHKITISYGRKFWTYYRYFYVEFTTNKHIFTWNEPPHCLRF